MPTTSPFIDLRPRGTTPLEVGVRDGHRWCGFLFRAALRGLKLDLNCDYGQTDGRHGFYNEPVLNKLTPAKAAYVVGHECGHISLNHIERFARYKGAKIFWNGKVWSAANVASDVIINPWLRELNEGARQEMINAGLTPYDVMVPLGDILIDIPELYDTRDKILCPNTGLWITNPNKEDLSSEQLIEKILKTHPVPPINVGGGSGGDEEQSDEEGEEAGGSGSGTPNPDSGDEADEQGGGGSGSGDDTFDGDSSGNGEASSSDESAGGGATVGEFGGGHDDFREPELEDGETLEEFHEANRAEAKQAVYEDRVNEAKGLGGGEGQFASSDLNRTTNRVPWTEHLANWFQTRSEEGLDRPFCHRAFDRNGIVRRARGSKVAGELVFLVDTSGSNVDKMGPMLDKVQEVLDQFQPRLTHVVPVDRTVHETYEVDAGGQLPDTLGGGGGTLFKPAFDWAEENAPNADGIIYLTDGYTWEHDWNALVEPNCPVLWLCFGYHSPEDIGVTCYHFGERVAINVG